MIWLSLAFTFQNLENTIEVKGWLTKVSQTIPIWGKVRPKQRHQLKSHKRDYTQLQCTKTVFKKGDFPKQDPFQNRKPHPHTCVYSHMILIISCTGKSSPTSWLCAVIRSFTCMCPDVNLSDVRCCERPATSFKRTLKGPFPWKKNKVHTEKLRRSKKKYYLMI